MRAFLAFTVTLALGCAATSAEVEDDGDSEQAEGAASLSSTSTYYEARRDFRKCMYPMCGGWWVHRVNRTSTTCADGSHASECYVAEIDWSLHEAGSPRITGAHAWIDCEVTHGLYAGDHFTVIAQVPQMQAESGEPLVFHTGRLGRYRQTVTA